MNHRTCRSVQKIFDDVTFNKVDRKRLRFDNKKLNFFFENGILNYSLVEIIGDSGSGKTQFALTLCAEQLLKTFEEKKENIVFYIYINRIFPMHRLTEIVEKKLEQKKQVSNIVYNSNNYGVACVENFVDSNEDYFNAPNVSKLSGDNFIDSEKNHLFDEEMLNQKGVEASKKPQSYGLSSSFDEKRKNMARNVLQNLYIQKINDETDFFILFEKEIYYILKYYKISLLVIDSFNSIFNGNEKIDSYKKHQLFIKFSLILKKISYENDFFVLLINSSQIKKAYNSDFAFDFSDYIVSLSCSNTIIILKRTKKKNQTVRKMTVKCSEFLSKYKSLNFEITDSGFTVV
ncbi:conserved Plasmodium protein, unknown function [Plasmodium malariae]|uniref:Rad51-like C-terminal domain-containing protein n=1 Tax=Plasmodium malariae TaxID=5858 RepID=A0A1C3KM71_PLAMA|nr:conserved Plasmodium protein, unknown function [Plasmodium malariae]